MASPLLTKYVEFKAKGLGDLKRETKQYTTAAKDAAKMVDSLKKAVESGAYATQTRELAAARRELEGYARTYARLGLDARFGRLGGGMAYYTQRATTSQLAQAGGYAAATVGGMGVASARAGFAGSLQEARANYQMERINRQFAASLTPVVDRLIEGLEKLATKLEGIGPGGQNVLGGTVLAGAGLAAYGGLSRLLGFGTVAQHATWAAGKAGQGLSAAGRGLGWLQGIGTVSSAGGGVTSLGMGLTGGAAALGGASFGYSALGLLNMDYQDKAVDRISPLPRSLNRVLQGVHDFTPNINTMASLFTAEGRRGLPRRVGQRLDEMYSGIFGGGLGTPTDPTARRQPPPLVGGGFDQAGGSWYRMHEAYQRTGGGSGTGDLEEAMAALTKELKRANDREGKPDLR